MLPREAWLLDSLIFSFSGLGNTFVNETLFHNGSQARHPSPRALTGRIEHLRASQCQLDRHIDHFPRIAYTGKSAFSPLRLAHPKVTHKGKAMMRVLKPLQDKATTGAGKRLVLPEPRRVRFLRWEERSLAPESVLIDVCRVLL